MIRFAGAADGNDDDDDDGDSAGEDGSCGSWLVLRGRWANFGCCCLARRGGCVRSSTARENNKCCRGRTERVAPSAAPSMVLVLVAANLRLRERIMVLSTVLLSRK